MKIHRIGNPGYHDLIFPLIIIEIFSEIERFQSKALKSYEEMAMKIKKTRYSYVKVLTPACLLLDENTIHCLPV